MSSTEWTVSRTSPVTTANNPVPFTPNRRTRGQEASGPALRPELASDRLAYVSIDPRSVWPLRRESEGPLGSEFYLFVMSQVRWIGPSERIASGSTGVRSRPGRALSVVDSCVMRSESRARVSHLLPAEGAPGSAESGDPAMTDLRLPSRQNPDTFGAGADEGGFGVRRRWPRGRGPWPTSPRRD